MAKGFQSKNAHNPHLPVFVHKLKKACLKQDSDRLESARHWGETRLGIDFTNSFLVDAISHNDPLDLGIESLVWLLETLINSIPNPRRQELMEMLDTESRSLIASQMVRDGLVPGVDFSPHPDGGFLLSQDAVNWWEKQYSPEHISYLKKKGFKTHSQDVSLSSIETNLGLESGYFEKLFSIIANRLNALYLVDDKVGIFAQIDLFLIGIICKLPELDSTESISYMLHSIISVSRWDKLTATSTYKKYRSGEIDFNTTRVLFALWEDILTAMGEEIVSVEMDGKIEPVIAIDQIKLVNKVWENPIEDKPLREMIALLESYAKHQ